MEKKILYKKSQIGYAVPICVGFVLVFELVSPSKWGISSIFPLVVVAVVAAIFYKLTIVIDEEKIYAYFGYNFFRRKLYLKDINFQDIWIDNLPWLTGVGIRLTSKGCLYNVGLGKAIRIIPNDGQVFFVGTKEPEVIEALLLEMKDSFKENS